MDALDCPNFSETGVSLVPWDEHDADDWQEPGVNTIPEATAPPRSCMVCFSGSDTVGWPVHRKMLL